MDKSTHRWKFHRVGGLEQVSLASAQDLEELGNLDQKLWTALSCPVRGLELDPRTLELLDTDKDGRVRAPEIIAAVNWCKPRLRSLEAIIPGAADLPLAAIDPATAEGKALLGAARQILSARKNPGATAIGPADVADVSHVFDGTTFNGDGVVTPAAAEGELAAAIADAMACAGSEPDRSGAPGIDRKRLDAFFADLAAYAAWCDCRRRRLHPGLGAATGAAWKAVSTLRAKVDDYFTRCRLAAFDPRGPALLNRSDADLAALAARDLSGPVADLAALPLARAEAGRPLPLGAGANPA